MYAKKELCVWRLEETSDFNQCTAIKVKCGCEDVVIHSVYRSPNSSRENDAKLCAYVKEMRGTNILVGDFNYPDINWETGTTAARGRDFFEATTAAGMDQFVNEPTHISGNTLDLILCNKGEMINAVR